MNPRRQQHRQSYNEFGHAHELTFGCDRGFWFLERERVCNWLADAINKVRQDQEMAIWAYVFMPNHVHLLIHFGCAEDNMASVLKEMKWPVSRKALAYLREHAHEWLPKLQAQRGTKTETHFWQRGGGYDRNVTEPQTLEKMIQDIHLNPVRKGLVERATDWKWSSANWYAIGTGPIVIDRLPPEWTVGMTCDS
ncbi:MAG: transposase [Planctomycetaceae bacterium]